MIPGFISSPSASILNNTTGTQDITATAINITGGNDRERQQRRHRQLRDLVAKDHRGLHHADRRWGTASNGFIQSGSTTVGTMEVHTSALTLTGQTSNATIGGGPGSSTDITVTGNTTLTGSADGGAALIGLLGTTTNAAYTVKFTGTGDLSLTAGSGGTTLNPGSAFIGAGSNHTNPTVDIDVKAANVTLTAGDNNGGAFIGNSNNQTTVGGGDDLGRGDRRQSRDEHEPGRHAALGYPIRRWDAPQHQPERHGEHRCDRRPAADGGNLTTNTRCEHDVWLDHGGRKPARHGGGHRSRITPALTVTGLSNLSGGSITLGGANAFNTGTLTSIRPAR